jgi:hypothetical protein
MNLCAQEQDIVGSLPFGALDRVRVQERVDEIGHMQSETP